ncbi:hypothetical protein V8C86DRAFT_1814123 [Haematococcus lacustris]
MLTQSGLRAAAGKPVTIIHARLPRPFVARTRQLSLRINAKYASGRSGSRQPDIVERVLAAVPYVLPWFNAVMYGRFLFYMYPAVKACIKPVLPAISAFHSIPFGSLIAFFGIYLGIVNNQSMSRFVRVNAMQAMLLDVLLVMPRLVESVITVPSSGWGVQLYANFQSFIWIFTTAWVIFGIANSLLGQVGRIPFIAEAADQQVR